MENIIKNKTISETEQLDNCTFIKCIIELDGYDDTEFDKCTFTNCKFKLEELSDFASFFSCEFNESSEKALREEAALFIDYIIDGLREDEAIGYAGAGESSFYITGSKISSWLSNEGAGWGYYTAEAELSRLVEELDAAIDDEDFEEIKYYKNLLEILINNLQIKGAIDLRSLYVCTRDELYPDSALMTERDIIEDYCTRYDIKFYFKENLEELKYAPLKELLEVLPKLA